MKITDSSTIIDIDYKPETQTLLVTFMAGTVYSYQPITATEHTRLLNSPSKGTHHATFIKTKKNIIVKKLGKGLSTPIERHSEIAKNHQIEAKESLLDPNEKRSIEELSRDFHQLLQEK